MAKKKNHWYVLVMTDEGPKFVTKINHSDKTAEWDVNEKPLEMSDSVAKDLAFGLMCNFFTAFPVCLPIEWESHPYNYAEYHIEWASNAEEDTEEE